MTATENNTPENPFTEIDAATNKRKRLRRRIIIPLIVALVIGSPFLYRASRLWKLPDIGEPFDVQEFVSYAPGDDENAFTVYREIAGKITPDPQITPLNSPASSEKETESLLMSFEAVVKNEQRDLPHRSEWETWLNENEEMLLLWKEGTACNESLNNPPAELQISTLLEASQELRSYARLVVVKAKILADDGKLDEAWNWYRALFRSSRHLGHRSVFIDRIIGDAIYSMAAAGVRNHWVNHPNITDTQLATAIRELTEINEMTPPLADCYKSEYLMYMNTLSRNDWELLFNDGNSSLNSIGLWFKNEPEFSRRLMKIYVAETLFQMEKSQLGTKDKKRASPIEELSLTGGDLKQLGETSIIVSQFPNTRRHVNQVEARDKAHQAVLIALLSAYRFKLAKGSFPKSIDELQSSYPEMSYTDPNHKSQARPLRYQIDNERLKIWSVGHDGADNSGDIARGDQRGTDVGYEIKLKTGPESAENSDKPGSDSPSPK